MTHWGEVSALTTAPSNLPPGIRGNVFPDFGFNKSKSGNSIIIGYPWPMKIKVGYKSGVVTMDLRGQGKGSFEYHRDVCYVISDFMCEKGYFKFVNVFQCKNF